MIYEQIMIESKVKQDAIDKYVRIPYTPQEQIFRPSKFVSQFLPTHNNNYHEHELLTLNT